MFRILHKNLDKFEQHELGSIEFHMRNIEVSLKELRGFVLSRMRGEDVSKYNEHIKALVHRIVIEVSQMGKESNEVLRMELNRMES